MGRDNLLCYQMNGQSLPPFDWGTPGRGECYIRSRAIDLEGNVQPPSDDPFLASRRTYWESNGQITRRVMIS